MKTKGRLKLLIIAGCLFGPFVDQKAAKKWEADFKKAGGDGFMWKSENGVVVTALKSK